MTLYADGVKEAAKRPPTPDDRILAAAIAAAIEAAKSVPGHAQRRAVWFDGLEVMIEVNIKRIIP